MRKIAVIAVCVAFCLVLMHRYLVSMRLKDEVKIPASFSAFHNNPQAASSLVEYLMRSRYWRATPTRYGVECVMSDELKGKIANGHTNRFSVTIRELNHNDSSQSANSVYFNEIDKIKYEVQAVNGRSQLRHFNSVCEIELSPNVHLTIHEYELVRERNGTCSVLEYLGSVVSNIAAGTDEECLLAEGSIRFSPNETDYISVENAIGGVLKGKIQGWVNFGERGFVELRFSDPKTNNAVGEKKRYRTREYVGWSDNMTNKYSFATDPGIDGDGNVMEVVMALMFYPASDESDGTEKFSTNVLVRTWVR